MASLIKGESQDRLIDAASLRAMLECAGTKSIPSGMTRHWRRRQVGGVATGLELRLENTGPSGWSARYAPWIDLSVPALRQLLRRIPRTCSCVRLIIGSRTAFRP